MKFIVWLIRLIIFVVFLVLALGNLQDVQLNLLAGYVWNAPMIVVGLVFFVIGALAGLLAALPGLLRRGREISRLRREVKTLREQQANTVTAPHDVPPMPPII
ncbi:lipopolysaccharide assembly protein LapA domain-containing protein [Robbsia sp. KACC 23696]|uniref:LapA family protein n=1 Tax=Robbsia sp. KACC 23696 TaxID=3149231 RepID=UPI00325B1328